MADDAVAECASLLCVCCFFQVHDEISRTTHPLREDRQRVEILFLSDRHSKYGFKIKETRFQHAKYNKDPCDECFEFLCCCCLLCSNENQGNGLNTSTQVLSVTRGGLAESLGVRAGWGLEKVGEIQVRNLQISTIHQILGTAQFPVVLTFTLPRGETARGANLAHVPYAPVYTPPDMEISRHDNGNQDGHVVKPDWY